ncbi:MAG: hypothetical protein Q8N63_01595, partial [Nanoarchaeota archaeon]|nr:hypothetical protein [Nanoarchaeota archaeon]
MFYIMDFNNLFKCVLIWPDMLVTEKQLKGAENKINKKIEDLKQKVSINQGNIILTSREIILGEHNHCLGSFSDNMNYVETGIINGELNILKQDFSGMKSLKPIGGFFDSNHPTGDYHYFPDVQIPVKNRLNRRNVFFGLNFPVEDLEGFEETEIIGIERLEFDLGLRRGLCSSPGIDLPYLNSLEILIGEQEIRCFAKGKVLQEQINDFLNLIKNPGEIKNRINQSNYNERKKLAEELVQNVARLSIFNNRIKMLEERLLNAKFHSYSNEGGWDTLSRDSVYEYKSIMETARKLSKEVEKNFNDADKTQLINLPEIDMRILGIPQTVKTGDFLE